MSADPTAADAIAAAVPTPVQAPSAPAVETVAATTAEPAAASTDEPAAAETPQKRGRKRKVPEEGAAAKADAGEVAADGVQVEGEAGKTQSAKKKKATPAPKRKPGRPKKTVDKDESETEDELDVVLNQRVAALPEEVRGRYGSIVWAKMVSYPFWPALIVDPRRINNPGLQESLLKEIDTKYLVRFYHSNDFYPVLIKNVVEWDDTKFNYRDGHPSKDAKAPKRRNNLMAAIELADKDISLPIDERMDGIMKETRREPAPALAPSKKEKKATSTTASPATSEKRKPGRPPGSKNKPRTSESVEVTNATPSKSNRGRKANEPEVDGDETEEDLEREKRPVATPTIEDEDENSAPPLTKEEIKAKVASRKAPSKKKGADDKAAAAAAPKKSASALAKAEAAAKAELDSKRKKEIELVVPQKTVKSADIREATAEAARKKIGGREKPADKGEYKVGNLAKFASKMTRLFANESSKNNDELIQMLMGLFEEKLVYRSDMERSGVAAIIAALRKSSNQTVAQTASAVRKHLMKVLDDDVTPPEEKEKKTKAEGEAESKPAKKQKIEAAEGGGGVKAEAPATATTAVVGITEAAATTEVVTPAPTEQAPPVSVQPETTPETDHPVAAAPVDAATAVVVETTPAIAVPKPDPSGDKGRMMCIDMLKKALAPIGDKAESLALEVEEQVFDRFKESNDDYRTCARSVTFGLKKSSQVRERLNNGSLHALELAYDFERIFKEA